VDSAGGPGTLDWRAVTSELVAEPVWTALGTLVHRDTVRAATIDPSLADTAEFCQRYAVALAQSANCVVIAGRRGAEVRYAACVVLATTRADVNGVVRRVLDARKASFAPMQDAVSLTGMRYGGITPVGLPAGWLVLLDRAVVEAPAVVVGSGLRSSKLLVGPEVLRELPGAEVIDGLAS
jgi:prolyl-tRNA editing enzyme YbaK/EbsC (Cys-tRNA(Pro) deacylase)